MDTPQNQTATVLVTRATSKCIHVESSLHTILKGVNM